MTSTCAYVHVQMCAHVLTETYIDCRIINNSTEQLFSGEINPAPCSFTQITAQEYMYISPTAESDQKPQTQCLLMCRVSHTTGSATHTEATNSVGMWEMCAPMCKPLLLTLNYSAMEISLFKKNAGVPYFSIKWSLCNLSIF